MINPEYRDHAINRLREYAGPFIARAMANRDAFIAAGEFASQTLSRIPPQEMAGFGLNLAIAATGVGISYAPYLSLRAGEEIIRFFDSMGHH